MPLAGQPLTQPNPIDALLDRGIQTTPAAPAVLSANAPMTWAQLHDLSDRLATQYLALGLNPGDRIASLMPNRPALVVHYLACLKAGLVATPLNYRYMPPEIDHALDVSGALLLVHHAERDNDVQASQVARRLPKGVVRFEADRSIGLHYEDLITRPPLAMKLPTLNRDAPAFIYFTSGSTGKPKGVTHTRQTFGAMIASAMQGMEFTPDDIVLPSSSFSHIGASLCGLAILAAGGRLVIPPSGDSHQILMLLREHRPTVLWMLPAALIGLVRTPGASPPDFTSVRLCVCGGDKVSGELEKEFTDLAHFPIDENYGMTEIGMATISPPSGEIRLGSIGTLAPGYELSLRDDAGVEVPPGAQGRLWIRSPANMIGYWANRDATAQTTVDGWLDTGDIMRVDAAGYLWFCGRKKQIIIHDGSNICPQEVEEAVAEHPAIAAVGVIGIHDLVHGENVRAYVTFKDPSIRPTPADLITFTRSRVGHKAPEEIIVLDEMPLNASGKVDRVALKALAENGTPERSASVEP